jgi:hypothetical protein
MPQLLVGADPELFVYNRRTKQFVSAHTLFKGTKQMPHKIEHGFVQVDGTAAEFNIPPAANRNAFHDSIFLMLSAMKKQLEKANSDLSLVATPVAEFKDEYFNSLPDSVKEMGCDVDFNAWTGGQPNSRPEAHVHFRTAGGHVHLGWTDVESAFDAAHFYDCIKITKQLDIALYVPSLKFDADRTRRLLYGRPGSFRPKPYGVEYRVLSNFWLTSPELVDWVYDSVITSAELLGEGIELEYNPALVKAINAPDPTKEEIYEHCQELVKYGFPATPEVNHAV